MNVALLSSWTSSESTSDAIRLCGRATSVTSRSAPVLASRNGTRSPGGKTDVTPLSFGRDSNGVAPMRMTSPGAMPASEAAEPGSTPVMTPE